MKKLFILLALIVVSSIYVGAQEIPEKKQPKKATRTEIPAERAKGSHFTVNSKDTYTISIELEVDGYPEEASWNLYSYDLNEYYYEDDQEFTDENQIVNVDVELEPGDYSIDCFDTWGDGGIAGSVYQGADLLVSWGKLDYDDYGWFDFTVSAPVSCSPPTALSVTGIAINSAQIQWTAPTSAPASGYEWEVRTSGVGGDGPTGLTASGSTGAGDVNDNVSGLTSGTNYSLWVRSNCGGDFSEWAGPANFSTLCDAVNVPYTQDFQSVTAGNIPACTRVVQAGTGNLWNTINNPGSGFTTMTLKYGFNGSNPANTWYFIQGLNLTAGVIYRLSYNYGNNSTTYIEKLQVAYGASPAPAEMTTILADHPTINQNAIQINNVDFSPATTGVYYIGFKAYSATDQYNLYLDNISIQEIPAFELAPENHNFQSVNAGFQSEPKTFTLINNRNISITVSSIGFSGANPDQFFKQDANTYPLTIPAHGTANVNVVFKPTSVGVKNADLQVIDNNGTWTASLTGSGYLNAAQFLTATPVAPYDVQLNWQAPLPFYEIKDDDNSAEGYYWFANPTDNHRYSKKIVIPVNGVLSHISLLSYALANSEWESVMICPESSPNTPNLAAPLHVFNNVPVSTNIRWIILSLPTPLNVTAGQNLYVVVKWVAGSTVGTYLGRDLSSVSGRSFNTTNGGTSWTIPAGNHMIRAYMAEASKAQLLADVKLESEIISNGITGILFDTDGIVADGGEKKLVDEKGRPIENRDAGMLIPHKNSTPAIYAVGDSKAVNWTYKLKRGTTSGVYDTEISGITTTSYLDQSTAPGTAYFYAVEVSYPTGEALSNEASVLSASDFPFLEYINPESLLTGWRESKTFSADPIWYTSETNLAGGTANEFMGRWRSGTGTSRLISPAINTSGGGQVFLFFKHFYDAYSTGVSYKIQTSSDGINWTDESWGAAGTAANVGPENVYFELQNNLGGLTYIAWVLEGNHFNYDFWYVDNIAVFRNFGVTPSSQNLTCNASNDGTASLSISGGIPPYVITWSKDGNVISNEPNLTGLAAGEYFWIASDQIGASNSGTIVLTEPAAVPVPVFNNIQKTYDGQQSAITATTVTGTELRWYTTATGTEVGAPPSATTAGIYKAWVSAFDPVLGCESLRLEATLEIQKKTLTVAANSFEKCFNTPNPTLTINYSGFITGEGPTNLIQEASVTTTIGTTSPVGVYAGALVVGGAMSDNYAFSYVNGTITILNAPVIFAGADAEICVNSTYTLSDGTAASYTTLLWSSSGNGTFSNTGILHPVYTPGSQDISNGSVILTLTADPGSICSAIDQMVLVIQDDLVVSASIELNNDDFICIGTTTSFTATVINGGTPAYQWKVNNINSGTNSPDFSYIPQNGDQVSVVVTSSIPCAVSPVATSNTIVVTVVEDLIAGVSITSDAVSVCDFTPVTFTAYPVNGGNNPSYAWLVNGVDQDVDADMFTYEPLHNDVIQVVLSSDHPCAVQPVATSNGITMTVVPPYLELIANPTKGGTVVGTGSYAEGTVVTIKAIAAGGWEFVSWKNSDGVVISTDTTFDFTVTYCYEELTATFSSTAMIAGQLKYFNSNETVITTPNEYGVFYVQLFEGELPVSERQLVRYNPNNGLESYYEFIGVESGKEYTMKVWEEASNNQLGNIWTWNNWGGATANDALIMELMTAENPILTQLPWVAPVSVPNYTPYFSKVADMNNSNSLSAVDPYLLQKAMTGAPGYWPLPGGAHNFQLATTNLELHSDKSYPVAPDLLFVPNGVYNASTIAPDVYYEALINNLDQGLNVLNVYLVATGDINASYNPGTGAKDASLLNYNGIIASTKDSELVIPVKIDQSASLAAMSLGLSYDNNLIEVIDVEGYPIHFINAEAGTIRISWVDQNGRNFAAGETLLNVKIKIVGDLNIGDRYFELLEGIEFADMTATVINGISLTTPYIESGVTSVIDLDKLQLTHSSYPNPFKDVTQINYTLPESGKVSVIVYNYFGQEVKVLTQEVQTAGSHQLQLNNFDLRDAGNYFYRITLDGQNKTFSVRGTLVFVK